MKKRETLILITTCLAFGALAMAVVMCLFIGFGLHTVVGKEALYTALVFQGVNLLALGKIHRVLGSLWLAGAALALIALILPVFGLHMVSPWVRWTCIGATVLVPTSWLGIQIDRSLQRHPGK